jgi:hypothetical protein
MTSSLSAPSLHLTFVSDPTNLWLYVSPERHDANREDDMQVQLAQHSFGRILLHLACAFRDHKYQWHWRGVCRELFQ